MTRPYDPQPEPRLVGIWNRLWHITLTKFLGNLNDNAFKSLVILIAIGNSTDENRAFAVTSILSAMFMLPFLALPTVAGWMADRFSRRQVLVWMKYVELAIMGFAVVGLMLQATLGMWPLYLSMVLMAIQSTLFSPSYNGMLPDMFDESELSAANGISDLLGYFGIIMGLGAGGAINQLLPAHSFWLGLPFLVIGGLGIVTVLYIPKTAPPGVPEPFGIHLVLNYFREFRYVTVSQAILFCVLGQALFASIGFMLTNSLITFGKYSPFGDNWGLADRLNLVVRELVMADGLHVVHLSDMGISTLQLAAAVGIGVGCMVAGMVSGDKVEFGLVPFGAVGMALFTGCLLLVSQYHLVLMSLFMLGLFGGFFTLPLNVYLQERTPSAIRGKTLAAANALSFWAMFGTSLLLLGLTGGVKPTLGAVVPASAVSHAGGVAAAGATAIGAETLEGVIATGAGAATSTAPAADVFTQLREHFMTLDARSLYLGLLVVLIILTLFLVWRLPEFMMRMVVFLLTRIVYSLRILHKDRLPRSGPVLLIANHVSMVDGLLLSAVTSRPIYFLAHEHMERIWWLRPFVKWTRLIPLPTASNPKALQRGLEIARARLREGEIVCIFPEGRVTGNGLMGEFKRGFLQLLPADLDVPIIPVHLGLLWGSIFSHRYGEVKVRKPRSIPYPVTITFGDALPADITPARARAAVCELDADAEIAQAAGEMTLTRRFVHMCRRRPFAKNWHDSSGTELSNIAVLIRAYIFAAIIRRDCPSDRYIGFILPASTIGAVLTYATLLADKTPVFLNFTASEEAVGGAKNTCAIRRVYTSRTFLEKAGLPATPDMVYLEDLAPTIRGPQKLAAILRAIFLTSYRAMRHHAPRTGLDMQATATVLFSSGSTGIPKGVPLTHHNLTGNLNGVARVLGMEPNFVILGSLPFFHSFGFMATLCLPMAWGLRVVYHPNPMDAGAIGDIIQRHGVTMLLATPTFLQAYTRKCKPEQMTSLRLVITGAEKLRPNIAEKFAEKFGIVPIEGYGTTELSPVVSVNMPTKIADVGRGIGKPGSVGLPLPGIAVKTIHPDTGALLDVDEEGLLLIKGPNVMNGYLDAPEQTAAVLKDGWYNTGDIARLDREGYIFITGRMSRFSKIGGEMVPHLALEDRLNELLDANQDTLAIVTSVEDPDRGERLIVLHLDIPKTPADLVADLRQSGLPNLWIPKARDFHRVDGFPLLGSGKFDLAGIKDLARRLDTGGATPPAAPADPAPPA